MAENEEIDWDTLLETADGKASFCKWFWSDEKGNGLIEEINKKAFKCQEGGESGRDFIRRENERSRAYIYGVLFKHKNVSKFSINMGDWRFVKVGLSQVNVSQTVGNRMTTIVKEVTEIHGKDTAVGLFCLPIMATDKRTVFEVEKEVRKHFGIPVDKRLATYLELPIITEWILTKQAYVNTIQKKIKEMEDNKCASTTAVLQIEFSRDTKVTGTLPNELEYNATSSKIVKKKDQKADDTTDTQGASCPTPKVTKAKKKQRIAESVSAEHLEQEFPKLSTNEHKSTTPHGVKSKTTKRTK